MLVRIAKIILLGMLLLFSEVQLSAAQDAVVPTAPTTTLTDQSIPSFLLEPETSFDRFDAFLAPLSEEELAVLAAHWQGLLQAHFMKMSEQFLKLKTDDRSKKKEDRAEWNELADLRRDLSKKFNAVLDAWSSKGGDPEQIKKYRRYEAAVLARGTQELDAATLSSRLFRWMIDPNGGVALAVGIAIFIASLIGVMAIAAGARRVARNRLRRLKTVSRLLQTFLADAVYWIVGGIGLMVGLGSLGVDVTPFFAIFGGASFILAFAFQDTLANLASGLMIMINRPFDEGDYVDVAGVSGTVRAVSIVATTVMTPDNQMIIIPNKNVWSSVITNVTTSATRRVDLIFSISYDDSIADAITVMERTVKSHPLVLADPEPTIQVSELSDNSVNFICRPWVNSKDYWPVYWGMTRQVKEAFDAAGISIPYPQRDVHVKSDTMSRESPDLASRRDPDSAKEAFPSGHEADHVPRSKRGE